MGDSLTLEGEGLLPITTMQRELGLETCVLKNRTIGGGKKASGCGRPKVTLFSLLHLLRLVGELGFG